MCGLLSSNGISGKFGLSIACRMLEVHEREDLIDVHLRHQRWIDPFFSANHCAQRLLDQKHVLAPEVMINRVDNVLIREYVRHDEKQSSQTPLLVRIGQTRNQKINELRFDEVLILEIDVVAGV